MYGTVSGDFHAPMQKLDALEFFAGSGLVRVGLDSHFRTAWANDNCPKKAAVYDANSLSALHLGSIEYVDGAALPTADLAWASFPCQDLSLAGNLTGIREGTRSGLFWQWIRVLDELHAAGKRPPVLVAENVVGFVIAHSGRHFRRAYEALRQRGYRVGALVIDAKLFVPQSRPRAFVVAVDERVDVTGLTQAAPSRPFHTDGLIRTAATLKQKEDWAWWSLPTPPDRTSIFRDLVEIASAVDTSRKTRDLRAMLSVVNRRKLDQAIASNDFLVGTGYRRTRPNARGRKVQRLELRFDGVAGCLRTPEGGSSRQLVVIVDKGQVATRLMSVRECARLMGAPETYEIPGSYNDGYRAMGDAVAVPVVHWLTQHLLAPLAERARNARAESAA